MSLQSAMQLLTELEGTSQLPADRVRHVVRDLLLSHEKVSKEARRFDEEAQAAMNLKLSFEVVGGGSGWPVSYGSNTDACRQLRSENHHLRHMVYSLKSTRFHQAVYQQLSLDESRVFFTPNAELSATCNALLCENKKLVDQMKHIEAALKMAEPATQRVVDLQQELDTAHRVARARVLEDTQTRQYVEELNSSNHNLRQEVLWLVRTKSHLQEASQHHDSQQAGNNATAGLPTNAQEAASLSEHKTAAEALPTPPTSASTGASTAGNGKQARDPRSSPSHPVPGHRRAIPAGPAAQTLHVTAPPTSSRLAASHIATEHASVSQERDDRAEVVAPLPARHDRAASPTAGQLSQPESEAQPVAVFDAQPALPHNDSTQHMPEANDHEAGVPLDAAAVHNRPSESYVAWDALVGDDDSGVEGWPDHADPVNSVPAAAGPISFLEAASKMAVSEDMVNIEGTALVRNQGQSAGGANARLQEGSSHSTSAAASRLLNAADYGWQTVGRKSAERLNAAGTNVQNLARHAAVGSRAASVSVSIRNTDQAAADMSSGRTERRLTRTQRRRQARRKVKA